MASEERTKEILEGLKLAVKDFEEEAAAKWAKTALEEGMDPFVATMGGLAEGMIMAGDLYNQKEYFVPALKKCVKSVDLAAGVMVVDREWVT